MQRSIARLAPYSRHTLIACLIGDLAGIVGATIAKAGTGPLLTRGGGAPR